MKCVCVHGYVHACARAYTHTHPLAFSNCFAYENSGTEKSQESVFSKYAKNPEF